MILEKVKCKKCGCENLKGERRYETIEKFEITDKGIKAISSKKIDNTEEIVYTHCPNCSLINNEVIYPKKCTICKNEFYTEDSNIKTCEKCSDLASLSKEELIRMLLESQENPKSNQKQKKENDSKAKDKDDKKTREINVPVKEIKDNKDKEKVDFEQSDDINSTPLDEINEVMSENEAEEILFGNQEVNEENILEELEAFDLRDMTL